MHYASGLHSRELLDNIGKALNHQEYNLLSLATQDNRLQSNIALLEQGVSLINESKLNYGLMINSGPNENVYDCLFKGSVCAVKHIKKPRLLRSHRAVPHAYGVVRGEVPKLVLSSHKIGFERLTSESFETEEKFGNFAIALVEAVLYCKTKNILHNNLNPSNILVEQSSGKALLCGFRYASYGNDGYVVSGLRLVQRFGNLCRLPGEVKRGAASLSFSSEIYCMGFTLLWECQLGKEAVGPIGYSVHTLAQDCVSKPKQQQPTERSIKSCIKKFKSIIGT
eukprot:gene11060-19918_t